MGKKYVQKPLKQRNIAIERISHLFREAKKRFKTDRALAKRYVILARKIAMKVKVAIPFPYRRQYCLKCNAYWWPGINCRVRLRKGMVVHYCLECKHFRRFRYKS